MLPSGSVSVVGTAPRSVTLPPCVVIVLSTMRIAPGIAPPALNTSDSGAPVDVIAAPLPMTMSRPASSVSVTGVGGATDNVTVGWNVCEGGWPIVMSPKPSCAPPPVTTRTSAPPFSALASVAVVSVERAPADVNTGPVPPATAMSWPISTISRSYGSSSHCPGWPKRAPRSIAAGCASSQPPEVSTKPPLPPALPPRALKRP